MKQFLNNMKIIADIGTNLYDKRVIDLLLPHFLSHYKKLGVTCFILHGAKAIEHHIRDKYKNENIIFRPVTRAELDDYRTYDKELIKSGFGDVFALSGNCPLYLIQNELKSQHVKPHEFCFIADLDEFVDIKPKQLDNIIASGCTYARGRIRDRASLKDGVIQPLKPNEDIYSQLNTTINITYKTERADGKYFLTKGRMKHAFGHHGLLYKDTSKEAVFPHWFDVLHMKYFRQNMVHIFNSPHAREKELIDFYIKPTTLTELTS